MNTGTVPDYISGLAGGIGGAVGAIFTNPLEVKNLFAYQFISICLICTR